MTFRAYQQDISPDRSTWGQAWAGALGEGKDTELARAKEAVLLGVVTRCPVDALPRHGADVDLERSPIEDDASYRARLGEAFELHGWAGTHYGYAKALALTSAQIRGARFMPQYKWPGSRAPDGLDQLWSRFWVYVWTGSLAVGRFTVGPWAIVGGTASPFTILVVGSFVVGDGSTVGSSVTRTQLAEIRRALAKWKNARDRVPSLGIASGAIVGMPGLVVGGFTVGGSLISIRLDLIVGSFVVGATPDTDPSGPWSPYLGRSNLV